MLLFFLTIGIGMWLLGYFVTARKMSNIRLVSKRDETIILSPKMACIIFVALQFPINIQDGTMRLSSVSSTNYGARVDMCEIGVRQFGGQPYLNI